MKRFQKQFYIGMLLFVLASAVALFLHGRFQSTLPKYAYLTGWVLFLAMVILTLFNVRKKLPFLPLGNAETWLQIHIYGGFFTVVLFLIHLNFRMPTGAFEITLAGLFGIVTVSGIVGLFLSRVLPRRLSTRGGEVLYENIPRLRFELRQEAETVALAKDNASPALAEFYVQKLSPFFSGARNLGKHLLESRRPLNELIAEMDDLRRYLNETERANLERLVQLVRQKDGLDYHFALQSTLKLWLFVHLPFTYGLMIFTLLHIVLVFAFSGGAR